MLRWVSDSTSDDECPRSGLRNPVVRCQKFGRFNLEAQLPSFVLDVVVLSRAEELRHVFHHENTGSYPFDDFHVRAPELLSRISFLVFVEQTVALAGRTADHDVGIRDFDFLLEQSDYVAVYAMIAEIGVVAGDRIRIEVVCPNGFEDLRPVGRMQLREPQSEATTPGEKINQLERFVHYRKLRLLKYGSTMSRETESQDHLSSEERSELMSRINSKETEPEQLTRGLLHRRGYRFRKNVSDLPGTPDVVLPKYDTVIFVHGCYWHRHNCRQGQSVPTKNREFWLEKFERNVERDAENEEALEDLGWQVLTIWECELNEAPVQAVKRLADKLDSQLDG